MKFKVTTKIRRFLKRRTRHLNLAKWLLIGASVVAVLRPVISTCSGAANEETFIEYLRGDHGPLPSVLAMVKSQLFLIIVVLSGWGGWLNGHRQRVNQLRLRRSEQKYRSIINYAGEAIFLLDSDGIILEWNKAAERLFNISRRVVLGRPFGEVHFCYGIEVARAMADATRLHRSLTYEFPFPRRNRPEGQVSLTISPFAENLHQSDSGYTFVILARDITSEKQLETRIGETEKLAGLGQLAAGTAHQLNTPLGSILLSAQMLEESSLEDDQLEDVRRIIRQTEQSRDIIKGLLNFARPADARRTALDLGEVIRETVYLMEKNIKLADVSVDIRDSGGIRLHGNRNELGQVFFNLLVNALDAVSAGGRITISLDEAENGENLVTFADEGEGIPDESRDKVFLPFYTTKEYGKGTGLGLSIVSRIVHEHGGRIHLESCIGEGTTFFITFPSPGYGLVSVEEEEEGEDKPQ